MAIKYQANSNTMNIEAFRLYFEQHLLGKNTATFDVINSASVLAGRPEKAVCPDCAKAEFLELINIYNSLPAKEVEEIFTKFEDELEKSKPQKKK